jgi:hypothetical protein
MSFTPVFAYVQYLFICCLRMYLLFLVPLEQSNLMYDMQLCVVVNDFIYFLRRRTKVDDCNFKTMAESRILFGALDPARHFQPDFF